jgi:hypothetical protein
MLASQSVKRPIIVGDGFHFKMQDPNTNGLVLLLEHPSLAPSASTATAPVGPAFAVVVVVVATVINNQIGFF